MERIVIKKLFNRFTYNIQLKEDGLTILTGPNGYGKSTILNIVNNLASGPIGFLKLLELVFDELEIHFKNGERVIIKNDEKNLIVNGSSIDKQKATKVINELFTRNYGIYYDGENFYDRRQSKMYTVNEYLEKIINMDENDSVRNYGLKILNDLFSNSVLSKINLIKDLLGNVYIIKEQRLIKQKRQRDYQMAINVIDEIPFKINDKINIASSNYSTVANELDASYPNRLFENEESISEEEFNIKLADMNKKTKQLSKYQLSSVENLRNTSFKPEHAKALKIYFDDFEKKFIQYQVLLNEFEMFTEIVNKRLRHKQIMIEKNKGIIVKDSLNNELKLSDLSSGEKHVIVLFYELIFGTEENTLLLIDEPEISLHIVWQKMFMDDLLKIINMKNLKVIVATHSAQIINNHWERQIDLAKLYDEFH